MEITHSGLLKKTHCNVLEEYFCCKSFQRISPHMHCRITADSPNKDKYSNFEPGHSCKPIERYLEQNVLTVKDYALPKNVIERYLSVMDIVTPHSKASTCFTKSYAKYVEGTGSILSISKSVDEPQLRYFTPREVANLMGFPKTFQFPESLSRQQKYRLLGNSLNVLVVAHLLSILIK